MNNHTNDVFSGFDVCSPTDQQREAFTRAMSIVHGKWKMDIIWALLGGRPLRFGELLRAIPGITQHMLTTQLRAMEADGLVIRTAYAEIPPRVEYQITAYAYALGPILLALVDWVDGPAARLPSAKKERNHHPLDKR